MALTSSDRDPSALERALGLITEVRAGEGVTALLLTANIFLLLMAYYIIKPVREALILEIGEAGARYKSYMGGVIAVGLLLAVPAYSAFAARVPRNRLVISVTLFFASNLVLFYFASFFAAGSMWMGLGFYLWVGIFNMMVIAQAWAFAADIYTDEQGKRLFVLIGAGATLGAVAGSAAGSRLAATLGVFQMLLVAAGILALLAVIVQVVHLRESKDTNAAESTDDEATEAEPPVDEDAGRGAFAMVFAHKYLLYLAAFSVVFTLVNTNGEYMLGELVSSWARGVESAGELPEGVALRDFIGAFYGDFFFWVNLVGAFLQLLVVSRLVKYAGLKVAFLILPFVALLDAGLLTVLPMLAILRWGKVAENSVDYSVNNTVRNMLWLPTTREMKYRAKQAVDTFFVRMGDVGSAALVFGLAELLHLGVRWFAAVNIVVSAIWIALAIRIIAERQKLIDHGTPPTDPAPS